MNRAVLPTLSSAAPEFRLQSSTHFRIHYTSIDAGSVATIADRLEAQYTRITTDLSVTATPTIDVFL